MNLARYLCNPAKCIRRTHSQYLYVTSNYPIALWSRIQQSRAVQGCLVVEAAGIDVLTYFTCAETFVVNAHLFKYFKCAKG